MDERAEVASRAEQQRRTRAALLDAGARVFARDGFHGASLDRIAAEAGYSKGAVYSNFSSKADLFLAVIDRQVEQAARPPLWDPFDDDAAARQHELDAQLTGGADLARTQLASVEFIAAAARDPELLARLEERQDRLFALYRDLAGRARRAEDERTVDELAALAFALDQGFVLLVLSGLADRLDARLLADGMRRLLDPSRAADRLQQDSGGHP